MSTGWIKLHRQLLEWEWYSDINVTRLFLHLMLKANHKDKKYRGIVIQRGQLLTGRELLSSETGLSEQQIRTCLTKLKSTSDITIKSTSKGTLLTVDNYGIYQGCDDVSTSKSTSTLTNEQPTDNQRVTTNKNVKNDNNVNNKDLSVITDGFDHWWNLYPVSRRINKKGCLTKFKSKCKGMNDQEVVDLINLISKDVIKRANEVEDLKYMPTTEPYLNKERWNDES